MLRAAEYLHCLRSNAGTGLVANTVVARPSMRYAEFLLGTAKYNDTIAGVFLAMSLAARRPGGPAVSENLQLSESAVAQVLLSLFDR
jgi:hypothetical protein